MAEPDSSFQSIAKILHDLAHDIKQPVRGIRNYVQYLAEDCAEGLDDKAKEMLDTLQRLSRQIEGYVSSMLDGAYSDEDELVMEDVDLDKVLQSVQELLQVEIREANANVLVPMAMPTVKTSRALITRIFLNLIANAVKYNDSEIPVIEIALDSEASDPTELVYCVKDNGIGIPETQVESVFRPSVRLHEDDRFGPGLGIGLTLTRLAIERLGGRIWIESKPNFGSTVRFTLPKG